MSLEIKRKKLKLLKAKNNIAVRKKLKGNTLEFTKYFFKENHKRSFVIGKHHIEIANALDAVRSGEITRLMINIAPRYGKTELAVKNFMLASLSENPSAKFIHLSYANDLALDNSEETRDIVMSDRYQELFPNVVIKPDSTAKKKWWTTKGGGVYATAAGGQITGFGAGKVDLDGQDLDDYLSEIESEHDTVSFGGCFTYDQKVITSSGELEIGYIVENKLDIEVLTLNEETKVIEYKPIEKHWKNPPNEIIEVWMSDNKVIKCTKDHKIMTNKGWVEAINLTRNHVVTIHSSYSLNSMDTNSELFSKVFSFYTSIISRFYNFRRKSRFFIPFSIVKMTCNRNPCLSKFDLSNNTLPNFILFCKINRTFFTRENLNNFLSCKFSPRSSFKQREGSVFNSILHVIGFRAIREIVKSVIKTIPVKMSNLFFPNSFSMKIRKNKLMNVLNLNDRFRRKANPLVTFPIFLRFKKSLFNDVGFASIISNLSFMAKYPTKIAYRINFFITKDRRPLFINHIGVAHNTYCLGVKDNHNFILNQNIIVSNCIIIDDPIKPEDAKSDTKRERINERYDSTISNRVNSRKTPIIIIMQRVHENDLCGYLLEKEPEKWTVINIPVINEDGEALWDFKHTIDELREMERTIPTVFRTQYMMQPTAPGGNKIKGEWFEVINKSELPFNPEFIAADFWIDGAFTEATENDESGLMSCYFNKADGKLYIFNVHGVRKELHELLTYFNSYSKLNNHRSKSKVHIELKASGYPLKSMLSKPTYGNFNCVAVPNDTVRLGKLNRVENSEPFLVSGKVVLVKGAWNKVFIDQCEAFPNGKHDDMIDCLAYAIDHHFIKTKSSGVRYKN